MCKKENENVTVGVCDELAVEKSSSADSYITEYIQIDELLSDNVEMSASYSIGIIIVFGKKKAFISDIYFDKKYFSNLEINSKKNIMFSTKYATIIPEDIKIQTFENVYLVRFVLGGKEINEKTGFEQLTINHQYPIEILRTYSKKQCVMMKVSEKNVCIKTLKEVPKDKLTDELREAVEEELIREIQTDAIFFPSSFPKLLKKVGIENYRRYADSIEEFVNLYLTPKFCFRKNIVIGGVRYPSIILLDNGRDTDEVLLELVSSKKISNITLDSEIKEKIQSELLDFLDENGVIYAANFPKVLQKMGVADYKKYASTVAGFVKNFLAPKFRFEKNYIINGKKHTGVILINNESGNTDSNFKTILENIRKKIEVTLAKNMFIQASLFPDITKTCGMINFRDYAGSVELFINTYLPEYELKKNVIISGTKYPGLIIRRGGEIVIDYENENGEVNKENDSSTVNYYLLDQLYDEGKYYEYLSSESMEKINFCELPIDYMEKTLFCATQLLYPDKKNTIVLTPFHKELFKITTSPEFAKKWKGDSGFSSEMIEQCVDTMLFSIELPVGNAIVVEMLNNIGYSRTRNDNYAGLTKRFSLCYNNLTPQLFFIRSCIHKGQPAVEKAISEYIQMGKEALQLTHIPLENKKNLLCSFTNFLVAVDKYIFKLVNLPGLMKTNIMSVYIDAGELKELLKVTVLLEEDEESVNNKLIKLYFSYETCCEEEIIELLDKKVSLQLFQKIISLIWEKFANEKELPIQMLNILCWVCLNDNATSIDEILRFHIINNKFTKLHKQKQLLNSLEIIYSLTQEDISMYVLLSYITTIVAPNMDEARISEDNFIAISKWKEYSKTVVDKIFSEYDKITIEREKDFVQLFKIFKLDITNQLKLQKHYAEWYLNKLTLTEYNVNEIRKLLDNLFMKRAYEAFSDVYLLVENMFINEESSEIIIHEYILSLVELQRYVEAITYIQQSNRITKNLKEQLLINVIIENFRNNGISAKAFVIFGDSFSIDYAIELLLDNILTNRYYIITGLIALYCNQQEYMKVLYLYHIFQSKTENGFTRLYAQIRKKIKDINGKLSNHYDVIELAFSTLYYDELMDFLKWTQLIKIPNFKGYRPTHAFAFFYNKIVENPTDEKTWTLFLSHLSKRVDINAWAIVVCETVLSKKIGYSGNLNSKFAIRNIINLTNPQELPFNFLPYVYVYLRSTNDLEIARDVGLLLKKKGATEHLIQENIWNQRYAKVMAEFKGFCIEQYNKTGDVSYYIMIEALGRDLEISDLKSLVRISGDKAYVYRQICHNYLISKNTAQTMELLNSSEWNDMTSRDSAVLSILKKVYTDNDELMSLEPLLWDERSVDRFKYDCAKILSTYPEKDQLFAFDSSCTNLKYKLLVYSYIFSVLYDEDIYDRYEMEYKEICQDAQLYKTYLRFLTSSFYAQLDWNVGYYFFYKKWRYLKLFLAGVLYSKENFDDGLIVSIMERKGHYNDVYNEAYIPFVKNVKDFMAFTDIEVQDKEYFLFALMEGKLGTFLKEKIGILKQFSEDEKEVTRKLIEQIDYREANRSLYFLVKEDIERHNYSSAISVAKAVSQYAYDTITALMEDLSLSEISPLFDDIASQEKPSEVVKMVLELDTQVFNRHAAVLIPLMCSRQFTSQIYGNIRRTIIQHSKTAPLVQLGKLTEYLSRFNHQEAMAIFNYMSALRACIEEDRNNANEIATSCDIKQGIPIVWKQEADNIISYALGNVQKFRPDRTVLDSSQGASAEKRDFSFIKKLKEMFEVEDKILSSENAQMLAEKYTNTSLTLEERLQAAVELLCNYPQINGERNDGTKLPAKNSLVLMIGLDAISPEISLTIEDQLEILSNLYSNRTLFSERGDSANLVKLNECYAQCLKRNISLQGWINYASVISEFLKDNHTGTDFEELRNRILRPAEALLDRKVSYEERYAGFRKLKTMSQDFEESVYTRNVFDSIQTECNKIEEGVQLKIDIVNYKDKITDGYVYFLIENVGKCTVDFQTKAIEVILKQDNHLGKKIEINNICNLQSGFITGGKEQLILNGSEKSLNVNISIIKKDKRDNWDIICSADKPLTITNPDKRIVVKTQNRYEVKKAVTDSEMLFGRQDRQEVLSDTIPTGITVIYGPSRIGKTSLMNWIMNDLVKSRGNVMSIIYGGEGVRDEEKYYENNFISPYYPVPYDDNEKISEYLLVSTIIKSFTGIRRLRKPEKKMISEEVLHRIVQVLSDDSLSIIDRYDEMNELLVAQEIELWILLDEFQQVVERWKKVDLSCEFVKICKMLSYDSQNMNIKLIVCGSDDLLRHMILEDKSVWRQAFPSDARVAVEPLQEKPFMNMIKNSKNIRGTNLIYSDSALQALYAYTGGVALYGKEICNVIIEDIIANPDKYAKRKVIYASDVAEATQRLIEQQESKLAERSRIREIYEAVTKNLRRDSDMQYLWYIAQWLHTNTHQDGFSVDEFSKKGILRDEKEMHDSLEIAVARGILREKDSKKDGHIRYVFRTIFYYFAFLGSADDNFDEKKIYQEEQVSQQSEFDNKEGLSVDQKLLVYFSKQNALRQAQLLGGLLPIIHDDAKANIRKIVGDWFGGDKYHNEVHINVQNITNTLRQIVLNNPVPLQNGKLLPSLEEYIPECISEENQKRINDLRAEIDELSDDPDAQSEIREKEQELEELMLPAEKEYTNDCSKAVLDVALEEDISDIQDNYSIINLTKEMVLSIKECLPEKFHLQYEFTILLHKLLYKYKEDNGKEIDFCPVALMYCKLIEGLLKEYHARIYSLRLSDKAKNPITIGDKRYFWNEFLDDNGEFDSEKFRRLNSTMGNFTFHIGYFNDKSDLSKGIGRKKPNIRLLSTPVGNQNPEEELKKQWEEHTDAIMYIYFYRNNLAHNLDPITSKEMDEITKILFNQGEFERIINLGR